MVGLTFLLNGQTTFTSISSDRWDRNATWDQGSVPTATDNVIIASGTTVTLFGTVTINDITIQAGGILDADNRSLTIDGNFVVDGAYTSSNAAVDLTFSGSSLGGSGSISINKDLSSVIFNSNATIISSADLQIYGGSVISAGVEVQNEGSIEFYGTLTGDDATAIWTNQASSYIGISDALLTTGELDASSSNNTVEYFQVGDQSIKLPNASSYTNLTISGSGIKTMPADLILNGDLTIGSGSLATNNFNIEIKGNWDNSATFDEGTGQVTFSGTSDQQISNGSGETFYDFLINKTGGGLTLNNDASVSSTLTMTDGEIIASPGTISLGTNLISEGTLNYTSGLIDGTFKRWVDSNGPFLFPVGANNNYQGLSITLNAYGSGGTLSASFDISVPGNGGLPLDDGGTNIFNTFNEGYWTLTDDDGFSLGGGNTYDISLDGNGFT
ncbi:MAG: hypothetical protein KAS71_05470, partial [Bacteroidales bacterium]|nr:hypothetical protein [Bacteroidales bacterium]